MFHIAYLLGSLFALKYVLKDGDNASDPDSLDVFNQLNLAHFLVPCFNLGSYICNLNGHYATSKFLDTISIF
jgi:hypothetical protein